MCTAYSVTLCATLELHYGMTKEKVWTIHSNHLRQVVCTLSTLQGQLVDLIYNLLFWWLDATLISAGSPVQ